MRNSKNENPYIFLICLLFSFIGCKNETKIFLEKFRENNKINLSNLGEGYDKNVKREFNDVTFVCEVYKKLFEANIKNEIVNIASNRIISLKDVIKNMNKISGYQINISVNPLFIRENEIINLSGSCNKLFSLIGEIKQKDFYETLEDMYNE